MLSKTENYGRQNIHFKRNSRQNIHFKRNKTIIPLI
jgi:hypothetical protein